MKKAIILALALVLTLSLAVPAVAVTSPGGQGLLEAVTDNIETETKTVKKATVIVNTIDPNKGLTEEQSAFWAKSLETEEDATEDWKTVLSDELVTVETKNNDGTTTKGGKGEKTFKPKTQPGPNEKFVAILFDGEKWVSLPVKFDAATGECTITGIYNAKGFDYARLIIGIVPD